MEQKEVKTSNLVKYLDCLKTKLWNLCKDQIVCCAETSHLWISQSSGIKSSSLCLFMVFYDFHNETFWNKDKRRFFFNHSFESWRTHRVKFNKFFTFYKVIHFFICLYLHFNFLVAFNFCKLKMKTQKMPRENNSWVLLSFFMFSFIFWAGPQFLDWFQVMS